MADISWTSGVGSAATTLTLGSPRPAPGNRFFEVVPDYEPIGEVKVALTGAIHSFKFREDYTLSLIVKHLSPTQHTLALMLKKHLMDGGLVTLTTNDLSSNVYSNVQLAPGTIPKISNDDDELQEFSFAAVFMDDSEMVLNYDG